jgi:thiamine-phosphate pyrophosphorylase
MDKIYRIIDANLNRAAEGLRVLEDTVRFIMEDKRLTEKLKNLRHSLLKEIQNLPEKDRLITSRCSREDVGTRLKEESRKEIEELLSANFRRVEEAERTLEECGKLISPSWGERFRQLRFQTYGLEKEIRMRWRKKVDYSLYVITESSLKREKLIEKVAQVVKGGASVIQLREKQLPSREFLARALELKKIIPPHIPFIINDRVDIALACNASGVHLGQSDLPLSSARKILGEDRIIGISTHTLKEAKEAEREGADYIAVGPVFATSTKQDTSPPLGVEIISRIKEEIKIPLVAIGGITRDNLSQVLQTGVDGVAIVSAIFSREDVFEATETFHKIIREFKHKK